MERDAFKALADGTRREILEMLACQGALTAGQIAAHFDMSAPSVSHHLTILKAAGLVMDTRVRQTIVYTLLPDGLERVASWTKFLLWRHKKEDADA